MIVDRLFYLFIYRKRDVSKTWIMEDDEDEQQTDTWTALKGGLTSWLQSRRSSNDRKLSTQSAGGRPKDG